MDRIPPFPLWVGHAGDGRDVVALFDRGIEAVVQVAVEEEPLRPSRELICLRFPLSDGTGNRAEVVRLALVATSSLLALGVPTLVCCGSGLSRAPALAAGSLAILDGETPESRLIELSRYRRCDVSPGFWGDVVGAVARTSPSRWSR
ncbi:MAG TPA: protein tyrosine phosphatase [Isosphaeraceae bacterium]|jgi:hypothetical protein|nr:protein tyrosine phosphatase [Isosphaeraceae bacterium]